MRKDGAEPVLIWGAGAMGASIGAWLIDAGHPVLFADQDRTHIDAINSTGLKITGPVRAFTVRASAVHTQDLSGRYHRVFLCVKAHHTATALPLVASHLADNGYVVSIQNGLNEEAIADVIGANRTVGAFVNFGADRTDPGVVMRGNRGAVVLGELDGRDTPRLRDLHRLLTDFEPDAVTTDNIQGYLWSKLAYGALLFATATTNLSIADALHAPSSRSFFVALGREVCAVAEAIGVRLESFDGFDPSAFRSDSTDADAIESLAKLVTFNRGSAKARSGIWRDLAVHKRPTEAAAQLGAIIDAGEECGEATPLTRAVLQMIGQIERQERRQSDENLRELSLL